MIDIAFVYSLLTYITRHEPNQRAVDLLLHEIAHLLAYIAYTEKPNRSAAAIALHDLQQLVAQG